MSQIDEDNDIIVLDDDDFIQTTLNLFESSSSSPSLSHVVKDLKQHQIDDDNESNLIDLTNCDDFDLNDLFMIRSHCSTNQFDNISSVQNKDESDQQTKILIKHEIDIKTYMGEFQSCMKEILIDDNEVTFKENNFNHITVNNKSFILNIALLL
jgi:hypothetical protein